MQANLVITLAPKAGNRAREEFAFRQGAKTDHFLVECRFEQRSMNVNSSSEFSAVGCRNNISTCLNGSGLRSC